MNTRNDYEDAWGGLPAVAETAATPAEDDFSAGWEANKEPPLQVAQNTMKNLLGGPDPSGASPASQRGMLQNGIGDPADQWSYDRKKGLETTNLPHRQTNGQEYQEQTLPHRPGNMNVLREEDLIYKKPKPAPATLDNESGLRLQLKRRGLTDDEISRMIQQNKTDKGLR